MHNKKNLQDHRYSLTSYLHIALLRSLQSLSQHASLSSVPSKPASHSSSPSTRKLPQKLSSGSEKQRPDLACNTFLMDRRLHGENRYKSRSLFTKKNYIC